MKLVLFFLFGTLVVQAQQVTTVSEEFNGSGGISLLSDGRILVADFGQGLNNPNGTVLNVFDHDFNRSMFATGFSGASGNVVAPDGTIFQSNIAGNRISRISPEGVVSTYATVGINAPVGVVLSENGDLYVANCGNNTIQKIDSETQASTLFSNSDLLSCPNGITIDTSGNFYVSNFSNGDIIRLDPEGNASVFATLAGGNNGHITYCEANHVLYAASHGSSRIYRLQLNGIVTILAGSGFRGNLDGNAFQAQFSRPNGIRCTKTGDTIFVNSSVPVSNVNFPLNPSLLRMITGINEATEIQEIQSLNPNELTLFPNPAQSQISVTSKHIDLSACTFEISSASGRSSTVLQHSVLSKNQLNLELPKNLVGGAYFLQIIDPSKNLIYVKPFTKEK